jgi:hypothetical protein
LVSLAVPNAAHALTWNWSFLVDNGSSGTGTFTTASTTAVANQDEVVTGATGTYTRAGNDAGTYTITGLKPLTNARFRWDGTPNSPIINETNFAINLRAGVKNVTIQYNVNSWNPVNSLLTGFSGADGAITSSTLSPVSSTPVPGPIPLLGAGAAFSWSRRLRRRVKSGSVPTASSLKTASLPSALSPLA